MAWVNWQREPAHVSYIRVVFGAMERSVKNHTHAFQTSVRRPLMGIFDGWNAAIDKIVKLIGVAAG